MAPKRELHTLRGAVLLKAAKNIQSGDKRALEEILGRGQYSYPITPLRFDAGQFGTLLPLLSPGLIRSVAPRLKFNLEEARGLVTQTKGRSRSALVNGLVEGALEQKLDVTDRPEFWELVSRTWDPRAAQALLTHYREGVHFSIPGKSILRALRSYGLEPLDTMTWYRDEQIIELLEVIPLDGSWLGRDLSFALAGPSENLRKKAFEVLGRVQGQRRDIEAMSAREAGWEAIAIRLLRTYRFTHGEYRALARDAGADVAYALGAAIVGSSRRKAIGQILKKRPGELYGKFVEGVIELAMKGSVAGEEVFDLFLTCMSRPVVRQRVTRWLTWAALEGMEAEVLEFLGEVSVEVKGRDTFPKPNRRNSEEYKKYKEGLIVNEFRADKIVEILNKMRVSEPSALRGLRQHPHELVRAAAVRASRRRVKVR